MTQKSERDPDRASTEEKRQARRVAPTDSRGLGAGPHACPSCLVPALLAALHSPHAAAATSTELPSCLSPPRSLSPKNDLLELAHELLGVHADAVVQRLQDTADTHDALAQTVERCYRLIRLSIDETKAEQFRKLGSTLLVPTI